MNDDAVSTFRLIYRSRDRIPADARKAEHGTLFTTARANNKRAGITGALLVSDGWFVQALEGDETVVRSLYERIEKDPRHDSVALIDARSVDDRVFPRWSMARVSANEAEPDTYLIAHADGIAPASSRGSSPAQENVLDTMRTAVRGDAKVR